MPSLVGLTGYPGSGKDTLADLLVASGTWKKVAFADALKDLFLECGPAYYASGSETDDSEPEILYSRSDLEAAKRSCAVVRWNLQRFGEAVRKINPDFWIDAASQQVDAYVKQGFNVVIPDVRYPNERLYLEMMHGPLMAIHRPNVGPVNDHVSETNTGDLISSADYSIVNSGAPEEMLVAFEECWFDWKLRFKMDNY